MLINSQVIKAISSRQTDMVICQRFSRVLEDTGEIEKDLNLVENVKGCFQQILRFDDEYSKYISLLPEGERQEASTVLWTAYPLTPSNVSTEITDNQRLSDLVLDVLDNVWYKVIYVRHKRYGKFYRAYLGQTCDPFK